MAVEKRDLELLERAEPLRSSPRPISLRRAAPRVSVVIPTMNEARNLPAVFAFVPPDIHQLVLVDGHSNDETVKVARGLAPDIEVVFQSRKGKGNALLEGFRHCTGDVIVAIDADGSTDPREIPDFVNALCAGADFAKGSRELPGGGSADITLLRRAGNWALTGLVNVLFGTRYTDLCYGYTAFWRDCLDDLDVDCDGFEIEAMLNVRAALLGLTIAEVPSYEHSRIHGASNLRAVRDGTRVLRTILAQRFRSPRPRIRGSVDGEASSAEVVAVASSRR